MGAPGTNQSTYTLPCPERRLRRLYVEKGMTYLEIARLLGSTVAVIHRAIRKCGIPARRNCSRDQRGARNPIWRGSGAGYAAFHKRVKKLRGTPKRCEQCGTTDPKATYDWASLTGKYEDPADYRRMCRKCHRQYDAASYVKSGILRVSLNGTTKTVAEWADLNGVSRQLARHRINLGMDPKLAVTMPTLERSLDNPRISQVVVKLTAEERALIERAVAGCGYRSMSAFVRDVALRAATINPLEKP